MTQELKQTMLPHVFKYLPTAEKVSELKEDELNLTKTTQNQGKGDKWILNGTAKEEEGGPTHQVGSLGGVVSLYTVQQKGQGHVFREGHMSGKKKMK